MPVVLESVDNQARVRSSGTLSLLTTNSDAGLQVSSDGNVVIGPNTQGWYTTGVNTAYGWGPVFRPSQDNSPSILNVFANNTSQQDGAFVTFWERSVGSGSLLNGPLDPNQYGTVWGLNDTRTGIHISSRGSPSTSVPNLWLLDSGAYSPLSIRRAADTGVVVAQGRRGTSNIGWNAASSDGFVTNAPLTDNLAPFGAAAAMLITGTVSSSVNILTMGSAAQNLLGAFQISSTTCTFANLSDYRLKERVNYFHDALDYLDRVNPVRFNWIGQTRASKDTGFLAHEFQEVMPQAVTGHRDEVDARGRPIYQNMDSNAIIPMLSGAVNDLANQIDDLHRRIDTLDQG